MSDLTTGLFIGAVVGSLVSAAIVLDRRPVGPLMRSLSNNTPLLVVLTAAWLLCMAVVVGVILLGVGA